MRKTPCFAAAVESAKLDGCRFASNCSFDAGIGSAYTGNWSVAYGLQSKRRSRSVEILRKHRVLCGRGCKQHLVTRRSRLLLVAHLLKHSGKATIFAPWEAASAIAETAVSKFFCLSLPAIIWHSAMRTVSAIFFAIIGAIFIKIDGKVIRGLVEGAIRATSIGCQAWEDRVVFVTMDGNASKIITAS